MALRIYKADSVPSIFCEGLEPGSLIPAYLGKHKRWLITGAGEVSLDRLIVISYAAIKKDDVCRALADLLRRIGYRRVDVYSDVEPKFDSTYGTRGNWRAVGGRLERM